jgi:glycosyltransferase involved in cell wall biosynthesis
MIEAALGGVPVACYDLGGIRDIVLPDETGILVPAGDTEAFAGAVSRLAHDPALRARLGDRAREWGKRFEIDTVAEEYARLYRSVLDGRRSAVQR